MVSEQFNSIKANVVMIPPGRLDVECHVFPFRQDWNDTRLQPTCIHRWGNGDTLRKGVMVTHHTEGYTTQRGNGDTLHKGGYNNSKHL